MNKHRSRAYILAGLVLVSFVVFLFRLINYQVVNGDSYRSQATSGYTRLVTLKAPRGEIVDRNGEPLIINRSGFNIQIDKAYLNSDNQNDVILSLIRLMEEQNTAYHDSLPMDKSAPFTFSGDTGAVDQLKTKYLGLNLYATEQNVLEALIKKYNIVGYSPEDTRRIAGVRYEMDKKEFTLSNPYIFAEDVSFSIVTKIQENAITLPGVDAVEAPFREYVMDDLAPHLLGLTGPIYAEEYAELKKKGYKMNDIVGKMGIEQACEEYLRGTDGEKTIFLNSDGQVVSSQVTSSPKVGNTVMLTLDKKLQVKTQQLLADYIENLQKTRKVGDGGDAKAGAVVVMNVKTGEILASATYPSYKISEYKSNYQSLLENATKPLINRAFYGQYSPGSTFKPGVGLAAMSNNILGPTDTVNCTHVYHYYSPWEPTCMGTHGPTDIVHALEVSCNIYFYDVGRRLGIDKLNEYCRKLGYGGKTGVEIGEASGILSSPEYCEQVGTTWYEGNVIQAAIGQLDTQVTPLQMATSTSMIANNGIRYQSHLIKKVVSYDMSDTIKEDAPVVADTITGNDEIFQAVRDGMLTSSLTGTSRSIFANYPIKIASKTGTPETIGDDSNHSAYIAFGPYENPEIAVSIYIENGGSGYYAASLCRDIFDAYFFPEKQIQTTSTTSK